MCEYLYSMFISKLSSNICYSDRRMDKLNCGSLLLFCTFLPYKRGSRKLSHNVNCVYLTYYRDLWLSHLNKLLDITKFKSYYPLAERPACRKGSCPMDPVGLCQRFCLPFWVLHNMTNFYETCCERFVITFRHFNVHTVHYQTHQKRPKICIDCTTPLFYVLAPTCFGSSLPSSGSLLDPPDLLEIQIGWVGAST
jgi:hypothetical protein